MGPARSTSKEPTVLLTCWWHSLLVTVLRGGRRPARLPGAREPALDLPTGQIWIRAGGRGSRSLLLGRPPHSHEADPALTSPPRPSFFRAHQSPEAGWQAGVLGPTLEAWHSS